MADRDPEDNTAPKAEEAPPKRQSLTKDAVRVLVDGLVPHVGREEMRPCYDLLSPEWRPIYERLRDDRDGAVSAALNQLKDHNPTFVLANLLLALPVGKNVNRLPEYRDQEVIHRKRATCLREIASKMEAEMPRGTVGHDAKQPSPFAVKMKTVIPTGTHNLEAHQLRLIAKRETERADACQRAVTSCGISRKHGNQRTAIIGAIVRDLARRIFGEGRVRHAAIAFLLSAAGGEAVSEREVSNALRSTVRTNTRSSRKSTRERVSL